MPKPLVLIVDDDRKTVELIKLYLQSEQYPVETAYDGRRALEIFRAEKPGLIILDLMLPRVDGTDVCRIIRKESPVPIIMLTARTTEEDKLRGLDLGADDYITKPFSPRELIARIRAVLRRTGDAGNKAVTELIYGSLVIDFIRHEAHFGEATLHLTPKEFKILQTICQEPGRIYTRSEIMIFAFGENSESLERTVDVHVMNLRKKLEVASGEPYIRTVYGQGYSFAPETMP